MNIDTAYLERCIETLSKALSLLNLSAKESIEYDLYRSACVKEYEIILEQSGKLLKKVLREYLSSTRTANSLPFKEIFRHAAQYDIIDADSCRRWLEYRDNRNITAHDYGEAFADETLNMLPQFILDSKDLVVSIQKHNI